MSLIKGNERLISLTLAAGLSLGGCGSLSSPDGRGVVGVIQIESDQPLSIVAPDTVAAGEPFALTVTTYSHSLPGNLCVDGAEDTRVRIEGVSAVVTPYDRAVHSSDGCPFVLRKIPHTAQLEFSSTGVATIIVQGRVKEEGKAFPTEDLVTVTREVVVR